jgi:hypothetical protein
LNHIASQVSIYDGEWKKLTPVTSTVIVDKRKELKIMKIAGKTSPVEGMKSKVVTFVPQRTHLNKYQTTKLEFNNHQVKVVIPLHTL